MRVDLNILVKILVVVGSSASIGFRIWHFFVPYAWKWYSYIDPKATELIVVVRAINVFFSLSLVLFVAGLLTRLLSRSTLKQYFTYAISRPDKQRIMDTGFYKYTGILEFLTANCPQREEHPYQKLEQMCGKSQKQGYGIGHDPQVKSWKKFRDSSLSLFLKIVTIAK
jgi:hypothetical protein